MAPTRAEIEALPPATTRDYIDAIAQHVSSVCIITTEHDGTRYGLTATAVSSVCAEPPRLLVCVNKSGVTHDKILAAGKFCVNVLTEEQGQIAMVFAGMAAREIDRFGFGTWTTLETGAPVLEGVAAAFDCSLSGSADHASHTVLFGDVKKARHQIGQDALLYGGRRFRQLRKVFAMAEGEPDYL